MYTEILSSDMILIISELKSESYRAKQDTAIATSHLAKLLFIMTSARIMKTVSLTQLSRGYQQLICMPLPTPKHIFGMALQHGSFLLKQMAKFSSIVQFTLNYALMNLKNMEASCRPSIIIMKQVSACGTKKRVSLCHSGQRIQMHTFRML
jgi:hypothetical protein